MTLFFTKIIRITENLFKDAFFIDSKYVKKNEYKYWKPSQDFPGNSENIGSKNLKVWNLLLNTTKICIKLKK